MRELVVSISQGRSATARVLRHKRSDVLVTRALSHRGDSVIIKLWSRRGIRHRVRRWFGRSEPWREAQALRKLNAANVAAPMLIDEFQLSGPNVQHTHAIVMEDLGECVRVVEHVTKLVSQGRQDELTAVESAIIDITADMIRVGVLDLDHSLNNMLMPPTGVPARVDLEFAVCCANSGRRPRLCGTMLGRLIGTYTFAVQPRIERVPDFTQRLYSRVLPSQRVRGYARRYVSQMMAKQRQRSGVDFDPQLPG